MTIILETKELSKSFSFDNQVQHDILKKVNLRIHQGEFVSVMGPSGSGKSTLLYNISGMDRLTAGTVMFDGQSLSALTEHELSNLRLNKMGFIFQHIHLLSNLNILDNIVVAGFMSRKRSRSQVVDRALKLMNRTGIAQLANHDITQASGGQLQRVGICRALINYPAMLFGDEPTGALNSKSAAEIMDILSDVNRTGTTILIVTHDAKVAARTERVIFMMDGCIVGEKQLGKYSTEDDLKERERELAVWLEQMGL